MEKLNSTAEYGLRNPKCLLKDGAKFRAPEGDSVPRHPQPSRSVTEKLSSKCLSNFHALQVVLKLLRFLGQAPFSFEMERGVYSCSWTSFSTRLTLVASALASFGMFIYFTHIGLKSFIIFPPGYNTNAVTRYSFFCHFLYFCTNFRIRYTFTAVEDGLRSNKALNEYKIETNLGMFTLLTLLMASQGQGHILHSWLNRHKLVKLMNNWIELRHKIRQQLQINARSAPRHSSNESNVLAWSALIYVLLNVVIGLIFVSLAPAHPQRHLEVTYLTLICGYFGISEVLLDLKVILIFNELRANFTQVRTSS